MQRKGPLPGKIFAWCILQRRFAGHFEYMESISCQNQLILDTWRRYLAMKRRFYRPRLLREYIRAIFCQECGSSSDRSALRRRFVQRARLRLSEMSLENASSRNVALRLFGNALQRCFVRGPSSAQANERWLLRCPAHVGLPLRCRGALGDAVLRSFGCWMSPLMRWRQRCVSRGSGTVHRKTERDGMMGLPSALYCGKVTSMIFSEEHIAHSSATALAKPNADIAAVLGSCAVMSQHLAQKCMSACAVMSEHLAQGCFGLAAVASQHWAQRSHCVAEFASITYRY